MKIKIFKSVKLSNYSLNVNTGNKELIRYAIYGSTENIRNLRFFLNEILNSNYLLKCELLTDIKDCYDDCKRIDGSPMPKPIEVSKSVDFSTNKINLLVGYSKVPVEVELMNVDIDIITKTEKFGDGNLTLTYLDNKLVKFDLDNPEYHRFSMDGLNEDKLRNDIINRKELRILSDEIKTKYLSTLDKLNQELLTEYGVTLKSRRTNSLSIIRNGKSIKSITIKQ